MFLLTEKFVHDRLILHWLYILLRVQGGGKGPLFENSWVRGTLPKKKLTKCQVFLRGATLPDRMTIKYYGCVAQLTLPTEKVTKCHVRGRGKPNTKYLPLTTARRQNDN